MFYLTDGAQVTARDPGVTARTWHRFWAFCRFYKKKSKADKSPKFIEENVRCLGLLSMTGIFAVDVGRVSWARVGVKQGSSGLSEENKDCMAI